MKYLLIFSKKCSALFFIFICVNFVFAQNKVNSKREVKNRVLTSKTEPELRIKFGKRFKFAGSHEFVLYNRAEAEQFFFVEAENRKIKRLYMLQFESFLPDIDGKYDYNEPQAIVIGGAKYFSNTEKVSNVEAALKAVPDSDIAKAAVFLQSKGFTLMKSLDYQRFVRVLDESKRSEFIMLYIEDTENTETSKKIADFQSRALANFKILK